MAGVQRYRLTYPETNDVWWSPVPNKCFMEQQKEAALVAAYVPSISQSCNLTFRPPPPQMNPYECLKKCKGIQIPISAADAERMKYPKRRSTNGCLREPSIATYTNTAVGSQYSGERSILNNALRNPPLPPQMYYKDSSAYDPILTTYGNPYTF